MKQKWSFFGFILGVLVGSGLVVIFVLSRPPIPLVSTSVVEVVFSPLIERINQERSQAGVVPLVGLRHLHQGALIRAALVSAGEWSHAGYEASLSAVTQAKTGKIGENLARGYTTEDAVVVAWLASPTHASVMLNSKFRYAGVGRVGTHWVLWLTENP